MTEVVFDNPNARIPDGWHQSVVEEARTKSLADSQNIAWSIEASEIIITVSGDVSDVVVSDVIQAMKTNYTDVSHLETR